MVTLDKEVMQQVNWTFTAFLKKKKLRKTSERYAILEAIYALPGHFDIELLYARLREGDLPVSRATVYNTVKLLLECDLITRTQFGQEGAQYEKSFAREHEHLFCVNCKKVVEFSDPGVQSIQKNIENTTNFQVTRHSIIFYATCNTVACKNKS